MAEYTITREDADRDLRALRGALARFPEAVSSSCIPALRELIDAIEEQTKPAIEEPTELWSVISANVPGSHFLEPKQLVRLEDVWCDDEGNGWGDFRSFSDVEVLRVGVGEPLNVHEFMTSAGFDPTDAQGDAFNAGFSACRSVVYALLAKQLLGAITAERKDALEKAIKAVEELAL